MTPFKTLLLAATLALPGVANADQTAQLRIAIGQADPATSAGRAAIRHRASLAAAEFCDQANERFGPKVIEAQRECREAIVSSVMTKLDRRSPSKAIARQ